MTRIGLKLLVAGAILTGAVGYLGFAGAKSGWVYYLEVDKYVADSSYLPQRVRLHGKVTEEDFRVDKAGLAANFQLAGHTQHVSVAYHGAIPDMFDQGKDVVVEGKMHDGVFVADVLMTKCASKYESNSPHANAPTTQPENRP
jgi:cytochrome c-type biogenesis protein CcmE